MSDAHRKFHGQTIDPYIIFMSLNRHSIDFFDKVMKLLLISVCFYTQSAHKYHFIILKILVACMLVMYSDMESRTWYNYNISFRDMINDLVFLWL